MPTVQCAHTPTVTHNLHVLHKGAPDHANCAQSPTVTHNLSFLHTEARFYAHCARMSTLVILILQQSLTTDLGGLIVKEMILLEMVLFKEWSFKER